MGLVLLLRLLLLALSCKLLPPLLDLVHLLVETAAATVDGDGGANAGLSLPACSASRYCCKQQPCTQQRRLKNC
jgi:hypothetical protein